MEVFFSILSTALIGVAWFLHKANVRLLRKNKELEEKNKMLEIANEALIKTNWVKISTEWVDFIPKPPKQNGRKD